MTLRQALQKIERGGLVDYTLGGHTCTRPPAVTQGHQDDCFTISPEPNNPLLWRPNAVPAKHLKMSTIASSFPWPALEASPLVLVSLIAVRYYNICIYIYIDMYIYIYKCMY